MGSSYLPPPEQNVVNVGDEISASTLAGLQYASPAGSQANPFATVSYLTGYAQLAGATFTGKVNTTVTATTAALNIATQATPPTSTVAGDVWIGTNINFKSSNGTTRSVANTNASNTFTAFQVVNVTSPSSAFRITQSGSGNAIEIGTPEANRFVVNQHGKIGIGVAPDASAALKVDTNGIMFGDGTTQTTAASGGGSYSANQAIADLITGSILYAVDEGMGTLLIDTRDESAGSRFPTFLSGLNWDFVSVNGEIPTWSGYGELTVSYYGGSGPWYISYNGVQASLPFGNFSSP
jgi:hypothetical protein